MIEFSKITVSRLILFYIPTILLFISVLNEFDLNYIGLGFISFNFPHILIFYWSLQRAESLGYGLIFIAGLFNDVVVGLPIGISSLSYLLICVFASYLKYITLRPSMTKDWVYFFITILIVNSFNYTILTLFFSINAELTYLFINIFFTFLFYIIFANIFKIYQKIALGSEYD